ncbi:phosphopantetheine-binding protein [Actinacidiphila soli]|uniref:phosphopantetheine-binding protein n=1 Tax=Actinacidiphila soli TaxID=2487275 RepID=UPI001F0CD876|nr:phosphopantetheine-binding protein [Actinacidiphila soli]
MTSVTDSQLREFTDSDLAGLLLAVGAEPPVGPGVFDDSFRDLDLDSLARTEIAARVVERWAVDVEEHLTPETTPTQLRRMVEEAVAGR